MAEDLDDHRRIFDGGDDLQSAAAVRAVFDVDVEDPFEQPGREAGKAFAHEMNAGFIFAADYVPGADIVESRVARHIVQGFFLAHVDAGLADDHGELDFVVQIFDFRRMGNIVFGADHRAGETYRKFKQPFFLIGAISPARRVVNRLCSYVRLTERSVL